MQNKKKLYTTKAFAERIGISISSPAFNRTTPPKIWLHQQQAAIIAKFKEATQSTISIFKASDEDILDIQNKLESIKNKNKEMLKKKRAKSLSTITAIAKSKNVSRYTIHTLLKTMTLDEIKLNYKRKRKLVNKEKAI